MLHRTMSSGRFLNKKQKNMVLNTFTISLERLILLLQNEVNLLPYIVDQAYAKGMQIALNPSPFNEKLDAIPGTPPNMIYPPKGEAFAARNAHALKIDFEQEPPFFKLSDTNYAATWTLHPKAPELPMPEVLKNRIAREKEAANV